MKGHYKRFSSIMWDRNISERNIEVTPFYLNGYVLSMNYGHMGSVDSSRCNRDIRIKNEIQHYIGSELRIFL